MPLTVSGWSSESTKARGKLKFNFSKMNDNVIHDWSDGKRVMGLSNAQIMKRYEEIAAVFKKDRK